ncbi:NfeD family protein [Sphingorhabdus soli]|uniref:NfeD family protein n=1 Tax=Flavisphingopyxis soli TaxID=2601267 RepID=A0A5C6U7Z1_9SPHN|nr:NfeD family protein [Sphingorhabdus soli]TXC68934.1 NfeD family protein [Sphingorhabdus soli]
MGDWLAAIDAYGWWLIAAIALAILEMLAPGVFFIWIAIAAVVTALASFVLPIDVPQQLIVFAVASLVSGYAGRSWYLANPVETEDDMLNDRVARLIGDEVIVVAPIIDGRGRVKVADGVWPARGPDSAIGARVRIVGADGGCLIVEALQASTSSLATPS